VPAAAVTVIAPQIAVLGYAVLTRSAEHRAAVPAPHQKPVIRLLDNANAFRIVLVRFAALMGAAELVLRGALPQTLVMLPASVWAALPFALARSVVMIVVGVFVATVWDVTDKQIHPYATRVSVFSSAARNAPENVAVQTGVVVNARILAPAEPARPLTTPLAHAPRTVLAIYAEWIRFAEPRIAEPAQHRLPVILLLDNVPHPTTTSLLLIHLPQIKQ
jgi:hypothetical protein